MFRVIYDGDEHQKFMEKLEARIKNHDKDIERMCNHYQGFVECIHGLLQVRPQAQHFKEEVLATNNELQKSSESLLRKAEELIKYRRVVSNTSQAFNHLQQCLPVLDMYAKLESQMEEKRYYPALKTLEQLEHTFLPRISKYRFAQSMCSKIPEIREQIKTASMTDLKDFLENIRQLSVKIGEIAMRAVAHQQNVEHFGDSADNTESDTANTTSEEELSATDLVDFSPVYRCLHIFGCLGALEQFEIYYRQQRQQQAKLALQSPIHMTIDSYIKYFCGVVGFLVIDDHIQNTSTGLVTKAYLFEVWENALQTIIASIRTHSTYCTDADLMIKLKRLIMLFSYTLQSYGYNISMLLNLLVEMRNQYNDILFKQWDQVFKTIFDADDYHPIQVNNQTEYNDIIIEFPYYESEVVSIQAKGEFPKKFPFSSFVPKIYRKVKQYILSCLKFSEDLNLSQTEIPNRRYRSKID